MYLHYMMLVPDDTVVMVLFSWIKPEPKPFLSPCANTSIPIDVSLQDPFFSLLMTKQFKVNLIMGMRKMVRIRHLNIALLVTFKACIHYAYSCINICTKLHFIRTYRASKPEQSYIG